MVSPIVLALFLAAEAVNDPLAAANEAFNAKDWPRATVLYREVVAAKPEAGSSWARLGRALRESGQPRESLVALQKAESLGFQPPLMQYQRALGHLQLGEKDTALALLRPLVTQQYAPPAGITAVDQGGGANDPRFQTLAREFAAIAAPCVQPDAPWRQFDFWLGSWDVYDRAGNVAGQSRIERILDGCVVLENWKGGSEGKSFNTWNPAFKRWEQSWVDNGTSPIFFTGRLEKGAMLFHSTQPQADGKQYERRLSFTPLSGGRVRQFSEATTDGGKHWSTEYDLLYIPQGKPFTAL